MVVGISQMMMTQAFRTLPVSKGNSAQMLMPVITASGAWWRFGERFTPMEIAGAAITLIATWRISVRK